MKKIEEARTVLSNIKDKDPVIDALITVLDNMIDAGDGDIAISDNDIGISITNHSVDIVNIEHDTNDIIDIITNKTILSLSVYSGTKITNKMILVNDISELAPNNHGPIFRETNYRMLKYEFHCAPNVFGRVTDYDSGELILEMPCVGELIEHDKEWLDTPYDPFELLTVE